MTKALVIAEHDHKVIKPATLATITAASQCADSVDLLIIGDDLSAVSDAAKSLGGVSRIIAVSAPFYKEPLAENFAPVIQATSEGYTHVLAPASTFGKNLLPRVAALLDVQQISDIIAVVDANTFVRPVYAGNAIATVTSSDAVKLITVRGTSFDALPMGSGAEVSSGTPASQSDLSEFVSLEASESERPELTSASIVVSGGRGVGSADNFALIEKLADKLGAAVGASRAAVDAGYVPNDYQVGQTGKIVAPELYIAIGISGAIQHLAGMKDSKVIVAINKDEDAPIFQVADYGLVADLFDAVPEMDGKL